MSAEIERLEQAAKAARTQLSEAEAALNAARIAAYGFAVGEVVEAHRNRDLGWQPAIIRRVEPMSWGCWFYVSFAKKNGDWSAVVQHVGSSVRKPETVTA